MPWNSLLAGATGGAAIFIVLAVLLGQRLIGSLVRLIDTRTRQIELRGDLMIKAMDGYDQQLSGARQTRYLELWALTAPVSKWPRNERLTYGRLEQLSQELRDWYFAGGGGLYLSRDARAAYGAAQEAICTRLGAPGEGKVEQDDYDAVQQALSAMRTALTDDLASRREISALEAIQQS